MPKHVNNTPLKVLIIFFIVFFAIIAGYEYFQFGSIFNNTEHFRKIYAEALELKNNEEYGQAFTKLEEISPRYEAYDAVLYLQSQCAAKTGDEASAQKRLKSLISKYPQSYLYVPSKYDLAKSYLRSNNNNSALDIFQNIINSHGGTDYEIGSYYYLAELNAEKNPTLAEKYWKKYISESQDGRFSADCVNRLLASKSNLTQEDYLYIGRVFMNAQNYDEAIKYLTVADDRKNWYYLAKIYIVRKNSDKAKKTAYEGLKQYAHEFSQDELAELIYALENILPSKQMWSDLAQLNQQKIQDIVLFNQAKYLPDDKAIELYSKIVDTHMKGAYSSEALKKLFWNAYKNSKYDLAKDYANKHINNFNATKSAPEMTPTRRAARTPTTRKKKSAARSAANRCGHTSARRAIPFRSRNTSLPVRKRSMVMCTASTA